MLKVAAIQPIPLFFVFILAVELLTTFGGK